MAKKSTETTQNEELEKEDLDDVEDDDEDLEEIEKKKSSLAEEHKTLLKALVEEELKPMKLKLDNAFKQRDAAVKEATQLKSKTQELEQKKLKDEGKHLEASQLRVTELEEETRILKEKVTLMSRDRELEAAIGGLEFKNDYARSSAFKDIISELVQDEDGDWIHKSGASLSEFIKAFAKDPMKEFFFKTKTNSGTGVDANKTSATKGSRPASLKELTTEELMKLAASGKLGSYTY